MQASQVTSATPNIHLQIQIWPEGKFFHRPEALKH